MDDQFIVSRYISNPMLVDGKFTLHNTNTSACILSLVPLSHFVQKFWLVSILKGKLWLYFMVWSLWCHWVILWQPFIISRDIWCQHIVLQGTYLNDVISFNVTPVLHSKNKIEKGLSSPSSAVLTQSRNISKCFLATGSGTNQLIVKDLLITWL